MDSSEASCSGSTVLSKQDKAVNSCESGMSMEQSEHVSFLTLTIFHAFKSSNLLNFNNDLKKKSLRNTIRVANNLESDQPQRF